MATTFQDTKLSFESIASMGREGEMVVKQFNELLTKAVHDLHERPSLKKARKITLVVELTPRETEELGGLGDVEIGFDLKSTVPAYRPDTYRARSSKRGLVFGADADDPRQAIFDTERKVS